MTAEDNGQRIATTLGRVRVTGDPVPAPSGRLAPRPLPDLRSVASRVRDQTLRSRSMTSASAWSRVNNLLAWFDRCGETASVTSVRSTSSCGRRRRRGFVSRIRRCIAITSRQEVRSALSIGSSSERRSTCQITDIDCCPGGHSHLIAASPPTRAGFFTCARSARAPSAPSSPGRA